MKQLAEMFRNQAAAKAKMYRAKAAESSCPEAVATWASLAELSDREAFMWECAAL